MTPPLIGPSVAGTTQVEVDGRIHVYSPATRHLVALNDTAGDVWRLCDGEHTAEDIVVLLSSSYGTAPEVIRADVHSALEEFVSLALLPAPATG